MTAIPEWVFATIASVAVTGVGTTFTIAMAYARMKVVVAMLDGTVKALHDRMDDFEKEVAKNDKITASTISRLDKEISIVRELDDQRERHLTPVEGFPVYPSKPKK